MLFQVELEKHPKYGRIVSTVLSCAADRLFTRMTTMQPIAIDRFDFEECAGLIPIFAKFQRS